MSAQITIDFDNSFANTMQGFYVDCQAFGAPEPNIIAFNGELAQELGQDAAALNSEAGAQILSGNQVAIGSHPLAQVYAGHQFGGFSQQLGDGRALLLGEVIDLDGKRRDIQLKGSGRTPFSRGGDGKSALGPVLREYIVSEAMHKLSIPTTRALAAITTGETVMRETPLPGGVLTRIAASHIRVGTFQFFAARGETQNVRQLADYAIARHYPDCKNQKNPYQSFLQAVVAAQAKLIAKWMLVGFVHGVMNTDNMTISGETIDYGPCAFVDVYDPNALFSSIDQQGRYAYKNQPLIGQWNLARLAECLIELIDDDQTKAVETAKEALHSFDAIFKSQWLEGMRAKLGLVEEKTKDNTEHTKLATNLLNTMEGQNIDYTGFFRNLAQCVSGDDENVLAMFDNKTLITKWLGQWHRAAGHVDLSSEQLSDLIDAMNNTNPIYIPRNHKVEEALEAAVENNDFQPFEQLIGVLKNPFKQQKNRETYAQAAPESFGKYRTFCGT